MVEDPLYRRTRQHARKRLDFALGTKMGERVTQLKEYLRLEREMLQRYQRNGDSGLRVTRAYSIMVDVLIERLFDFALQTYREQHGEPPAQVAVVGLGGYGRAELSPKSDVDIMFLYTKSKSGGDFKQLQEVLTAEILYPMWDTKLKVGHSSRTIREALTEAENEDKSLNAMLEMRFISGDLSVFREFETAFGNFYRGFSTKNYLKQRLNSQEQRREKYGGTVYLQEPDIKNGVGGLRDYQSILWMAKFRLGEASLGALCKSGYLTQQESKELLDSYNFLLRVRNELHFNSARASDLLDLENQPRIAWALDYKIENIFQRVERFMRDYYSAAQTIYQTSRIVEQRIAHDHNRKRTPVTFKAVLDARRGNGVKEVDGFMIDGKMLSAASNTIFKEDPVRLIRLFRYMQQYDADPDLDLRVLVRKSLPLITKRVIMGESANRAFRAVLQSPVLVHHSLVLMLELGVLSQFMPEFAGLNCLVQHEYYHRYTADIHTLKTILEADRIFSGKNELYDGYRRVIRGATTPALLYLMLLLHDIGKSIAIKDHAILGLDIARPILDRMGIGKEHQRIVLFIIEHHLEMARFWQRFDIDDPRTIQAFAELTGDEDTLRYLSVLTFCDAQGTAEGLWNDYKQSLHTHLFAQTLEVIREDDETLRGRRKEHRKMIEEEVKAFIAGTLPEDQVEAHFNLLPERYFLQHTVEEIVLHMRLIQSLLQNITEADSLGSLVPVIDWRDDSDQGFSVVTVVTWDRAGLFCKLAGALTVAGVNILSTKAISRSDHITIDTFYVVEPDGGVVRSVEARDVFRKHLEESLLYNKELLPEISRQARKFAAEFTLRRRDRLEAEIPPRVDIYHELSLRKTIVEVQSTDHLGLLYQLSRAIFDNGFDITFARIATERGAALDTFYIESIDGTPLSDPSALEGLRAKLIEILEHRDFEEAI